MRIIGLGLFTSDLDTQLRFYEEILGFAIIEKPREWDKSFTAQVGVTRLTFTQSHSEKLYLEIFPDLGKPSEIYHFAINVHENQIEVAKQWLEERHIPLLSADGQTIFNFENWNAHSVYFKDPAGNILEFIARHNLNNASDKPFGNESILCVSEIGITVDDVPAAVKQIGAVFELPIYKEP